MPSGCSDIGGSLHNQNADVVSPPPSITRNSKEWYKKSQYNLNVSIVCVFLLLRNCFFLSVFVMQHDVHLCGYTSLLRIVARFHDEIFSDPDSASGLNRV